MDLKGVWLPVVTPFYKGEVDYEGYRRLLEHYLGKGIHGIIPLGTTGESPVISEEETIRIIMETVSVVNGQVPVFAGLSGNNTKALISRLEPFSKLGIDGVLSACPYYNKPGQEGLYQHYQAMAEATDLKIIIYNIPHRTGVNMSNETVFKLAESDTIVGIKDSCGDISQSLDLLAGKPEGFAVLTGEDHLYFTNLAHGGDGGILASSHLKTEYFTDIYRHMTDNDLNGARTLWRNIEPMISLLFKEPNPGPLKYCLLRKGLIMSDEMRLPMTGISEHLKQKIDSVITE